MAERYFEDPLTVVVVVGLYVEGLSYMFVFLATLLNLLPSLPKAEEEEVDVAEVDDEGDAGDVR